MPALLHDVLCPHSRFARLALAELGVAAELVEARAWERHAAFLELNPAGTTPVLLDDGGDDAGDALAVPGPDLVAEHLDETRGPAAGTRRLLPPANPGRTEVRRLADWFNRKFHEEVSGPLLHERLTKRRLPAANGGGAPDMGPIRAARANLRTHLAYVGHLAARRDWLAGPGMTLADLAAAAHLSVVDYLGDLDWSQDEEAKRWYQRLKSRPSFRPLLAERAQGLAPPAHYDDLDF